jgi:methyl-accepting chemotaxis protein
MANVSGRVDELRAASTEQERGNEVVMRGVTMMRDVAQQTHRTTEEQSRGVRSIRDSIESVRDAVDGIHGALQGQSEACRAAVDFLQQVHEQTDANHKSAAQMRLGTQALSEVAEALREDVRRFRV